jgi:hypothetical protein
MEGQGDSVEKHDEHLGAPGNQGGPSATDGMPPPESRRMPASVAIVAGIIGLTVLLGTVSSVRGLLQGNASWLRLLPTMAVPGFLLLGMIFRLKLAWQWARIGGLAGAAVLVALGLSVLGDEKVENHTLRGTSLMIVAALYLLVFLLLELRSSDEYFGLVCPKCGESTGSAADFLFMRARCRKCRHVW